MKSC